MSGRAVATPGHLSDREVVIHNPADPDLIQGLVSAESMLDAPGRHSTADPGQQGNVVLGVALAVEFQQHAGEPHGRIEIGLAMFAKDARDGRVTDPRPRRKLPL